MIELLGIVLVILIVSLAWRDAFGELPNWKDMMK